MFRTPIRLLAVSAIFFASAVLAKDAPVKKAAPKPLPAYHLVKEKSTLKFYAIQNSAPIEGQFKDFSAVIHFDPDQLEQGDIKVEVSTASIAAANDDVEKYLKLPEWLSVEAFPKAVFSCKKLTRMPSSDNYYADGTLTLRGKTKPVVLNFQMEHFDEESAIATGYVTIHRNDFGVGQGQWSHDDTIKNEVRIEFRIVAEKNS